MNPLYVQVEDLKESDHKYKLELCSDVLSVLNIVEPGLNLGRGKYKLD